jgi:chorismate dehydratase
MARFGAVSYLNSKPLVEGLAEFAAPGTVRLDFPSRLADQLAHGELDVALIPSIEFFRGTGYEIVSDACVAARGPVLSVKVYFRREPAEIETLALDVGSRTSATLARLLLAERHGVFPSLEPLPLELDTTNTRADAVLLIGDRAMLPPAENFVTAWDLGEEWQRSTGLPFVFALWAGRAAADNPGGLAPAEAVARARDLGESRLEAIARREAAAMRLDEGLVRDYLTRNLHYRLGESERRGLALFREMEIVGATGHGAGDGAGVAVSGGRNHQGHEGHKEAENTETQCFC